MPCGSSHPLYSLRAPLFWGSPRGVSKLRNTWRSSGLWSGPFICLIFHPGQSPRASNGATLRPHTQEKPWRHMADATSCKYRWKVLGQSYTTMEPTTATSHHTVLESLPGPTFLATSVSMSPCPDVAQLRWKECPRPQPHLVPYSVPWPQNASLDSPRLTRNFSHCFFLHMPRGQVQSG